MTDQININKPAEQVEQVEEVEEKEDKKEPVSVPEDLKCPITMSLLIDPIMTPCCFRSFSRMSLEVILQERKICPSCQDEMKLVDFDTKLAPRAVAIQKMIDAFKAENDGNIDELMPDTTKIQYPKWKITLKKVPLKGPHLKKIGQVRVTNENTKFKFKTLLLTVIDESGSMNGEVPQVRFALKRFVDSAYTAPNFVCHIVPYDNNARSFFIDTNLPKEGNYSKVESVGFGGGTNFQAAFDKIVEIMNFMKTCPVNNLDEFSKLTIVFMTDGQDGFFSGQRRIEMVNTLSQCIKKIWDKPFTVHTVGFSSDHDFEFLQKLSKAGTIEGAYKFADPKEDNDSLSVKINSLIQAILGSDTMPIKITSPPSMYDVKGKHKIESLDSNTIPIISGENGIYWVDITDLDLDSSDEIGVTRTNKFFSVQTNGVPDQVVEVELISQTESDKKLEYSWYSYQMDKIAKELYDLNSKDAKMTLDREIHLELLNQKLKALMLRIETKSDEYLRLENLIGTLKSLRGGVLVDKMKLADQMSEGQYKTIGSGAKKTSAVQQYTPSNYTQSIDFDLKQNSKRSGPWKTIDTNIKRVVLKKESKHRETILTFTNKKFDECLKLISSMTKSELQSVHDDRDSNLLIMMCMSGRVRVVKELLKLSLFLPDGEINELGYSALDCAIMFGYWKIYDLLKPYMSKSISINSDEKCDQFRTCLTLHSEKKNMHIKTAQKLITDKYIIINDEMIDASPSYATSWLLARSTLNLDMDSAIIKGVFDVVDDKITKGFSEKLDWSKYHNVLTTMKGDTDHMQIFELLLEKKLLNPDQVYEIPNPIIDRKEGIDDNEITWPLFVASEKGNMSLFNLLMKYVSKESIMRQNKQGTYCMWIASCNKHIDIVSCLLSKGSDPNMVNKKGENCIIPACQKSAVTVIELLLASGARLDLYDRARENPFLLCCRIGQHVLLEMFFQRLSASELDKIQDETAKVDGLNPLLASVELDRVECVKICYNYRAKLEWKTSEDNKILPGATALHLACFYDRLDSLKLLLELGADPLVTTDVGGYNCMNIAVRKGHLRIVGFLMSLKVEIRDLLLKQKDNDGHTPSYYSKISGNEHIYQEYFCNRLSLYMERLLHSSDDEAKKCVETLITHGDMPGIYEYKDFTSLDMGRGMDLASLAIINGSNILIDALCKMNADFSKRDDYGVNASFWKALLQQTPEKIEDHKVKIMLDRVMSVRDKSPQNKMFLTTPGKPPVLLIDEKTGQLTELTSTLTPVIKMNDGYNQKVDQSTLKLLQKSGSESLLGFITKLKSGKNIPEKKDTLEYILWDSRIHVIKLIASEEKYLDPSEIIALYLYSTNKVIFEQVNQTLSKWKNSSYSLWHPFVITIYQAITHLPKFEGEVYRVVENTFDRDFYKINNQMTWSTFSICSKEYSSCVEAIKRNKGIVFIVKSKTGRDITRYSKTPADQDVIFLPESKFTITNYYRANQIALAQENIRNVTFKIREKDFQDAEKGQCIIIELQEI